MPRRCHHFRVTHGSSSAAPAGLTELAEIGVARVSVGSGFSLVATAAMTVAARELLEQGTYGFWERTREAHAVQAAFDV